MYICSSQHHRQLSWTAGMHLPYWPSIGRSHLTNLIQVRQLAAVEMRKRVSQNSGKLWTLLPQNEREEIKAKLPEFVLAEPKWACLISSIYSLTLIFASDLVRHAAARVIASIASNEFSHATWPQLLPYLIQTCMSGDVKHREVGIYIIFTVLEAIAEGFEDHMAEFFKIFQRLLADPESLEIRITTVRALGVLAQYIDVEDKKELVSCIFWLLCRCLMLDREHSKLCFLPYSRSSVKLLSLEMRMEQDNSLMFLKHFLSWYDYGSLSLHFALILHVRKYPSSENTYQNLQLSFSSAAGIVTLIRKCGYLPWMHLTGRFNSGWAFWLTCPSSHFTSKKSKIQHHNLAATILDGLMPITTEAEPLDVDDDAPSRVCARFTLRQQTFISMSSLH